MQTNNQSKTAVILNGSPRKHGNTAIVTQWVSDELLKNGWQISAHYLYGMNVKGCSHCDKCREVTDTPGCIIKDDFSEILNQITKTNLLVVASPVYCWAVSGCMSAALDRFCSFFKEGSSLIQGKQILGVFTAGGGLLDGMDLCTEMLKRLSDFSGAKYVGTVAAANCTSPEELQARTALKEETAQLIARIS